MASIDGNQLSDIGDLSLTSDIPFTRMSAVAVLQSDQRHKNKNFKADF